ncbi:hypothetical protein [Candidatus Harpocratesius sp.]
MQQYHFVNLSKKSSSVLFSNIEKIEENWIDSVAKIERVIFRSMDDLLFFLQKYKKELNSDSDFKQYNIKLITNVSKIKEMDKILDELNENFSISKKIQWEILCNEKFQMNSETIKTIKKFTKKYPSLLFPRFSLVYSQYYIDFTTKRKLQKKRSRRPSKDFQKRVKLWFPDKFPDSIGTEYYGKGVFLAFCKMFVQSRLKNKTSDQEITNKSDTFNSKEETTYNKKEPEFDSTLTQLNLPIPNVPMKYYDFQAEQENWIEIRFNYHISLNNFISIMKNYWLSSNIPNTLSSPSTLSTSNLKSFLFFRGSIWYEAWQFEGNFKRASHDRLLLTYADPEFAFFQQNPQFLWNFLNNAYDGTIYFQLTPPIEIDDFRSNLISQIFLKDEKVIFR